MTGFVAAEVGVVLFDLFDILGFVKIQNRLLKLLVCAAEYAGPGLDRGVDASILIEVIVEVRAIEEAWLFGQREVPDGGGIVGDEYVCRAKKFLHVGVGGGVDCASYIILQHKIMRSKYNNRLFIKALRNLFKYTCPI